MNDVQFAETEFYNYFIFHFQTNKLTCKRSTIIPKKSGLSLHKKKDTTHQLDLISIEKKIIFFEPIFKTVLINLFVFFSF